LRERKRDGASAAAVLLVQGQVSFNFQLLASGGIGAGGFSFSLNYLSGFAGTTSSDGSVGINFN
jgi:hypothetical protein